MEGYKVTIVNSSKELTARERVKLKDTGNATKLDELITDSTPLVLKVDSYATLAIHNEKSDNKDYENLVLVTPDGQKFITGSPSFYSSFMEIWEEMANEDEDWELEIYKLDSKNYKGKQFLTCSIA